ncbi:MAG: hypothetical protein AB7G93_16435 [Bdellovibrionales bacterium]
MSKVSLAPADAVVSPTLKHFQIPSDHAFADMIATYLRACGVDPSKGITETETMVSWSARTVSELSLCLSVYKIFGTHEMFVWIEAGIGRIPTKDAAAVTADLLKRNNSYFYPYRLAIAADDAIMVQFRSPVEGISEQYFKTVLESLFPFAEIVLTDLQAKFRIFPM